MDDRGDCHRDCAGTRGRYDYLFYYADWGYKDWEGAWYAHTLIIGYLLFSSMFAFGGAIYDFSDDPTISVSLTWRLTSLTIGLLLMMAAYIAYRGYVRDERRRTAFFRAPPSIVVKAVRRTFRDRGINITKIRPRGFWRGEGPISILYSVDLESGPIWISIGPSSGARTTTILGSEVDVRKGQLIEMSKWITRALDKELRQEYPLS